MFGGLGRAFGRMGLIGKKADPHPGSALVLRDGVSELLLRDGTSALLLGH